MRLQKLESFGNSGTATAVSIDVVGKDVVFAVVGSTIKSDGVGVLEGNAFVVKLSEPGPEVSHRTACIVDTNDVEFVLFLRRTGKEWDLEVFVEFDLFHIITFIEFLIKSLY